MLKRLILTSWAIVLSTLIFAQESFYVPIGELHPGQHRYTYRAVDRKAVAALENGDAVWHEETGRFSLDHDEGRSPYNLSQALPTVRSAEGLVLLDGHHDVMAALWLGAESVPVYVALDLSEFERQTFWAEAEARLLVYSVDLEGERSEPPQDFWDLIDDPNLVLAHLLARVYNEEMTESLGAEYPVWVKIGRDEPFAELRVADALREGGIDYSDDEGAELSEEVIERARQVLRSAKLGVLHVVSERTHYTDLDVGAALHGEQSDSA